MPSILRNARGAQIPLPTDVVIAPRFAFEKSPQADARLTTQMKTPPH